MTQTSLQEVTCLTGKVAIVTGGAVGIGYGIAYRLAEAGAQVVIASLGEEQTRAASERLCECGYISTWIETDVSDATQVARMVDVALETYGKIDILVNNAGIYPNIPLMELSETDFEKIVDTNLKSVFLTTKAVAAQMMQTGGGTIINITSIDAIHPSMIGLATYDASKHGVWGFTKNVALELAPHKIRVNAIAPGVIDTPGIRKQSDAKQFEEDLKPIVAKIPMRRMGEADDIGKVALFLASDLSSYMTGSQVVVDGGYLLT